MSTDQEYWDACLIRTWRRAGTTVDALIMFRSIVGKDAEDCGLYRCPIRKERFSRHIRTFVATRLPRISAWLFDCGAEKDAILLKKLSTSKYTLLAGRDTLPDPEKQLFTERCTKQDEKRAQQHTGAKQKF